MKVLILLISFLSAFSVFSTEVCSFEEPCDAPMELQSSSVDDLVMGINLADEQCPLDDPACPLPEGTAFKPYSAKAVYYLCISVNPIIKRYGLALSLSHYNSALWSYQRCRAASGPFYGLFCRRPQCMSVGI